MRDPSWSDDVTPLIQSMQAAVHARLLTGGHRELHSEEIEWSALSRGLRWILPKAHNAIRRREHTKSQLVELAHRFKRAFRYLGERDGIRGNTTRRRPGVFLQHRRVVGIYRRALRSAVEHALCASRCLGLSAGV